MNAIMESAAALRAKATYDGVEDLGEVWDSLGTGWDWDDLMDFVGLNPLFRAARRDEEMATLVVASLVSFAAVCVERVSEKRHIPTPYSLLPVKAEDAKDVLPEDMQPPPDLPAGHVAATFLADLTEEGRQEWLQTLEPGRRYMIALEVVPDES